MTNLLSNAIRYSSENGRIVIGARQIDKAVEIYVKDFGKGIDSRYHEVFSTTISVCREQKYKVAVWDLPSARTLWKLMVVRSVSKAKSVKVVRSWLDLMYKK